MISDQALLRATASIYRYFPWLPGRALDWLGFDLWNGNMYSPRWAKLGTRTCHAKNFPALINAQLGYWHQRYFFLTGRYYEIEVSNWLELALSPGDTFIDIGANVGMHTLHAAHLVGPAGSCYAVEPNPSSYAVLCAHVLLNRHKHIHTQNLALGNPQGPQKAVLSITCLDGACGSISSRATLRPADDGQAHTIEVDHDSGDRVFAAIPAEAFGVCKIDVEGWEMEVLRGMSNFIKTHPGFSYCIEVTPRWLEQISYVAINDLLAFFRQLNFEPFQLSRRGLSEIGGLAESDQYNLVFLHRTRSGSEPRSL